MEKIFLYERVISPSVLVKKIKKIMNKLSNVIFEISDEIFVRQITHDMNLN